MAFKKSSFINIQSSHIHINKGYRKNTDEDECSVECKALSVECKFFNYLFLRAVRSLAPFVLVDLLE